jgi:hypothetical protein
MDLLETFLWGVFGGVGAEAVIWASIRHNKREEYPYWIKSPLYCATTIVLILLGGGVAVMYARSSTPLNAVLAAQIGASAPLLLRKFTEAIPPRLRPPDPSQVD